MAKCWRYHHPNAISDIKKNHLTSANEKSAAAWARANLANQRGATKLLEEAEKAKLGRSGEFLF
jgi:hypothetical protein